MVGATRHETPELVMSTVLAYLGELESTDAGTECAQAALQVLDSHSSRFSSWQFSPSGSLTDDPTRAMRSADADQTALGSLSQACRRTLLPLPPPPSLHDHRWAFSAAHADFAFFETPSQLASSAPGQTAELTQRPPRSSARTAERSPGPALPAAAAGVARWWAAAAAAAAPARRPPSWTGDWSRQ
jgi:hypothetical protein